MLVQSHPSTMSMSRLHQHKHPPTCWFNVPTNFSQSCKYLPTDLKGAVPSLAPQRIGGLDVLFLVHRSPAPSSASSSSVDLPATNQNPSKLAPSPISPLPTRPCVFNHLHPSLFWHFMTFPLDNKILLACPFVLVRSSMSSTEIPVDGWMAK